METIYQATKISMQPWAQFFSDAWNSILRSINDVIQEIRVRHAEIVTDESSEKLSSLFIGEDEVISRDRKILTGGSLPPLRGSLMKGRVTQGSQSLTLGLTLNAASQLASCHIRSLPHDPFSVC